MQLHSSSKVQRESINGGEGSGAQEPLDLDLEPVVWSLEPFEHRCNQCAFGFADLGVVGMIWDGF